MNIIKLLCLSTFTLTNGFLVKPNLDLTNKPNILSINRNNNICMSVEPEYDPFQLINSMARSSDDLDRWNLNDFLNEVAKKHVESVTLLKNPLNDNINALVAIDNNYKDGLPDIDNLHYLETGIQKINDIVVDTLINNDIFYNILQNENNNPVSGVNFINIIFNGILLYFLISLGFSLFQRMGGGGSGMNAMNVGKIQSKGVVDSKDINTTFTDVAGCDEAKYELEEIVEFLKNPMRFYSAGAKVPKGVLLEGPPGTGKTLLARAVAGEAGVSFIQISASEFIQMFVGVGASRVRDLFDLARKNTPCVVFIDEIDAVGRKRGEQFGGGGNEEREQTLNQILTNMDGFEKTDSIIVLAATNRVDILDPALTRSGRFDRKVTVNLPDIKGRRQILDVHLKGKNVQSNTDLDEIAVLTSGFSGADIENMANEAVILALRKNSSVIDSTNLIDAYEKITIGLPLLSREVEYDQEQLVAYHEAGHTMMALLFRDCFDVRKVTIKANTNGAGGYTLFTPKEKYFSYPTKKFLLSNLIVCMGGRAAEIILYNKILNFNYNTNYTTSKLFDSINDLDITTGASADLKQADKLARQYIELFGIESNQDLTKTIQNPENPYISLSESTKSEIDNYVNRLVAFSLQKAIDILDQNMASFNELANDLIEKKSVDIKYLNNIDVNYY